MEKSLNSELKSGSKLGSRSLHQPIVREKTTAQKHMQNLINRMLNEYFGILVILVVLVILAGSYFLLIKPKYQKIVASINATFYEKNQLAPKYKELSNYKALIEAYKKVDPADIEKVSGLVPKEYLKEDLFTEMIYLASTKDLAVNDLNVVKDVDAIAATSTGGRRVGPAGGATTTSATADLKLPSGVGSFNVKIVLGKATYPALKSWLQAMENSLRIIDVRSLSFDPKASTATLEMTTYYLKK